MSLDSLMIEPQQNSGATGTVGGATGSSTITAAGRTARYAYLFIAIILIDKLRALSKLGNLLFLYNHLLIKIHLSTILLTFIDLKTNAYEFNENVCRILF